MTTKRHEWMRQHVDRTKWGETMPRQYRVQIVTRQGDWLATLVGNDPDALQARAQRMSANIRGSRVAGHAA